MKEIPWSNFKVFIDARLLSIQYIDVDNTYYMWGFDGPMGFECSLYKDGNADVVDFETNYKSKGNRKLVPDTDPYANSDIFKASCEGFADVALASQVTTIDHSLTFTKYLVGVCVLLNNHVYGDKLTFQIVHPIIGVVDEFATSWNVSSDVQNQGLFEFPLRGKLSSGLKIRLVYTSIGNQDVSVACNLILHRKTI